MNLLICPNCKDEVRHAHKQAICLECGAITRIPPLTDDAFERIDEAFVKEPKPVKQKKAAPVETEKKPKGTPSVFGTEPDEEVR